MFEHIRNKFPWNERARRKAELVKKLQNPIVKRRKKITDDKIRLERIRKALFTHRLKNGGQNEKLF